MSVPAMVSFSVRYTAPDGTLAEGIAIRDRSITFSLPFCFLRHSGFVLRTTRGLSPPVPPPAWGIPSGVTGRWIGQNWRLYAGSEQVCGQVI
jgi:hypothetical protein